jgi:hypothetical protein
MALTTLPALPPCGVDSPTAKQELELARTFFYTGLKPRSIVY